MLEAAHAYVAEARPPTAERLGRAAWGPWPVATAGLLGLAAASADMAMRSEGLVSAVTLGGSRSSSACPEQNQAAGPPEPGEGAGLATGTL